MAKTITFTDLPQPTGCTATPTVGGSLVDGTTYYYRIIGTYGASSNYWYGKSKASAEFSGTADATNKTMTISFSSPVGENNYYRIFRATTPGGMVGENISKNIDFYPSDSTYNSGGTVTFVDDGYPNTGGNRFLEIDNDPHGRLSLAGSTSVDKFSIVDLYDEDQAQGWGVIEKLDVNTYKVNTYMVSSGTNYWYDTSKTIIFADGFNGGGSFNAQFGYTSGNQTKWGCRIVISSTWLSSVGFGELIAYRTSFDYVYPGHTNGLGLVGGAFYSGIMQDCTVDKFRAFYPTGGAACTFKNCIFSKFDNLFAAYAANYDDVKCLGGSRVWQLVGNKTVEAKDVYIEGSQICLWIGDNNSLTVINTPVTSTGIILAGVDNSVINDKFSFNLNVVDTEGIAVENAIVSIYDKDSNLVVDTTTNSDGDIVEEEILRVIYNIEDGASTTDEKNPFTLVITKTGYGIYKEIVTYSSSDAIVKTVTLPRAGYETKIYDSSLYNSTIY